MRSTSGSQAWRRKQPDEFSIFSFRISFVAIGNWQLAITNSTNEIRKLKWKSHACDPMYFASGIFGFDEKYIGVASMEEKTT